MAVGHTKISQKTHSWERQPEDGITYHYFRQFLLLGPDRTLKTLAEKTGMSVRTFGNYQYQRSWLARARDYDDAGVRIEDETVMERRAQIAAEHAETWARVRRIAEAHLAGFIGPDGEPYDMLKPKEICLLLDRATHYERLMIGEATERTEQQSTLDTSALSPEEMATFSAILRKCRRE